MADERLKTAEEQESRDEELMVNEDLTTEVDALPNGNLYLTINGIMRLGKELGLSTTEVVRDHNDKEWVYEVCATDPDGRHRWGAATEVKTKKFSRSMCINKAQRNAFGLFLRKHPKVEEAIKSYNASNPKAQQKQRQQSPPKQQQAQPKQQSKTQPKQKNQTPLEKAKASALQVLKKELPNLQKEGISEATFWERVKIYFGYEKSDQMTAEDWTEVATSLKENPKAAWIRESQPKAKAA